MGRACTKTRYEVAGSNRKLYKQKGTGRARRGDKKSPLLKGGGVSHGPEPRNWAQKMPKKAHSLAVGTALQNVAENGDLVVVPSMHEYFKVDNPTETLRAFLESQGVKPIGPNKTNTPEDQLKRTLIIVPIMYWDLYQAYTPMRNVVAVQDVYNITVDKIMKSKKVIIDAPAFRYINRVLQTEMYRPGQGSGDKRFRTEDFEPFGGELMERYNRAEKRWWPKGTHMGMVLGDEPHVVKQERAEWKDLRAIRRKLKA